MVEVRIGGEVFESQTKRRTKAKLQRQSCLACSRNWRGFTRSTSGELASINDLIQTAISTAMPLAKAHGGEVRYKDVGIVQEVSAQPAMLQQALLNILTAAVGHHPDQVICVDVEIGPESSTNPRRIPSTEILQRTKPCAWLENSLSSARGQLTIEIRPNHTAIAQLTLPAVPQSHVLVIDDNPDTLRLFQRYSSGTRYRITGIQDPTIVMPRAADIRPQIIVLDVMMPGVDGWELLGRLREHPQLRGTPVIVATILPQEELALALGAVAFVRKPISRKTFLSVLDAQLDKGNVPRPLRRLQQK